MATAAARAALPLPNSACGIVVCPNKGMVANALKVDSGGDQKILCRTGESNLPQRRAGSTLYQLSYIPVHPSDSDFHLGFDDCSALILSTRACQKTGAFETKIDADAKSHPAF